MSVSWMSRIAWPGSRQVCRHAQCKRFTVASTAAISCAVAAVIGLAIALPDDGTPAVIAAAVFAAGLVLSCWPHPPEAGDEAFGTAIREQLPGTWTEADWDELERELNGS